MNHFKFIYIKIKKCTLISAFGSVRMEEKALRKE